MLNNKKKSKNQTKVCFRRFPFIFFMDSALRMRHAQQHVAGRGRDMTSNVWPAMTSNMWPAVTTTWPATCGRLWLRHDQQHVDGRDCDMTSNMASAVTATWPATWGRSWLLHDQQHVAGRQCDILTCKHYLEFPPKSGVLHTFGWSSCFFHRFVAL